MTKLIRRTSPAFRHINHAAPALSALSAALPTDRELGADHHWLLGSDNPNNVCMISGKRLHPNLRSYIINGGTAWTQAPTITLPNGGEAYALLTPSSIWTTTRTSGGSGYASAPTVTVTGGTLAAGGRLPRYSCIVGGGAVTAITTLDAGEGILSAPTIGFTGGGGSGAAATCTITSGVKAIAVTNGGSGYSGIPSVSLSGGTAGTNLAARAFATVSGGAVTAVYILDAGYGYTSAPTVSFASGGGTGAAATATIGTNLLRTVVITDPGAQSSAPAVTITGGDGSGASAGSIMSTATYTRTASNLNIPAGGATDNNAQNGLLLPMIDDGEFTVIVVAKKTNAATSQVVIGSGNNGGSAYGGFELKYQSSAYQVLDYNLQNAAAALTVPGSSGDYVMFVYSVTPVAGESVQPSSAVVQSSKLYARAGLSTAVSRSSGDRKAVLKPRLVGVGNCHQYGVTYRTAFDVAEVIAFKKGMSVEEIDAVRVRSAARLATRGITLVNA